MTEGLIETAAVKELLTKSSGPDHGKGNDRIKQITHRLLTDLFRTIEDFDIQLDEFWAGAGVGMRAFRSADSDRGFGGRAAALHLPAGPGIGVTLDHDKLRRYARR